MRGSHGYHLSWTVMLLSKKQYLGVDPSPSQAIWLEYSPKGLDPWLHGCFRMQPTPRSSETQDSPNSHFRCGVVWMRTFRGLHCQAWLKRVAKVKSTDCAKFVEKSLGVNWPYP